jgi:hypothetical protein
MSEISAMAALAIAMSQSNLRQQVEMSILKNNAKADQEVANMIMQNAKQIEALSAKSSGGIDLYA